MFVIPRKFAESLRTYQKEKVVFQIFGSRYRALQQHTVEL